MKEIPGSDFFIPADLVLLSMGFLHPEHAPWMTGLGISFNDKGNICVSGDCATNMPAVFAAGDAATGASLVCRCIMGGKQAALAAADYLAGLE